MDEVRLFALMHLGIDPPTADRPCPSRARRGCASLLDGVGAADGETGDGTRDARHILAARGLRAFGDGYVALLVPVYLYDLGFGALAVGAVVTGTLFGTALLSLWVGFAANRHSLRRLLCAAALLMAVTGAGFALTSAYWLLLVALVGTINPTSGDASIFLPLEQTALTQTVAAQRRTALFARYSVVGSAAGAAGILAASLPDFLAAWSGGGRLLPIRLMFALYALFGVVSFGLYRPLSPALDRQAETPPAPLGPSRRLVYRLAALFAMDSLGTGLLVQSLLALWLYQRFQLSVTAAAAILFWSSLCATASYFVAVPIAARIGLINTMVFTHLPSNILLMLVALAPNLTLAIALLLVRSLLSQMDVPTRASYVMAVVRPEERPAAASLTAVPKTFAWAAGSLVSGYLLTLSSFGWPLLIGGAIKGVYDILLLLKFRRVRPPEEEAGASLAPTGRGSRLKLRI